MEIRASIKQPGMFCLIWNDSGIEGGDHFTKIETITGKRDQDPTLWNGAERGTTLCIEPGKVDWFYDMALDVGVPIFPAIGNIKPRSTCKTFSGRITTTPRNGMEVQIKTNLVEGKLHLGKKFTIASEAREVCGTWVVALNNADGTRFSAAFDLSMLEITDLGAVA